MITISKAYICVWILIPNLHISSGQRRIRTTLWGSNCWRIFYGRKYPWVLPIYHPYQRRLYVQMTTPESEGANFFFLDHFICLHIQRLIPFVFNFISHFIIFFIWKQTSIMSNPWSEPRLFASKPNFLLFSYSIFQTWVLVKEGKTSGSKKWKYNS